MKTKKKPKYIYIESASEFDHNQPCFDIMREDKDGNTFICEIIKEDQAKKLVKELNKEQK